MINKSIILVAAIISLGIGIFIFYPIDTKPENTSDLIDNFKWSDNLKWNASIAIAKMKIKDEKAIKNLKLLLNRNFYKSYSQSIDDYEIKHTIETVLNTLAEFDDNNVLINQYFLKEFEPEIKNLKNNDSDLEIKKLAEQIYNEIK